MNENKYCTIVGRSVRELSFGMDEGHPDCIALKFRLANRIGELHMSGAMEFMCNCEWGVPLWSAEIITAMKSTLDIRLNIVMPWEGQANHYSKEVRERFFDLHAKANDVVILNTQYFDNCYRDADIYMIDNSAVLLTDDGDSFIAKYAVKEGKRLMLI